LLLLWLWGPSYSLPSCRPKDRRRGLGERQGASSQCCYGKPPSSVQTVCACASPR